MILSISGQIELAFRNWRPDTSVPHSKMKAADLVIGGRATPCIIAKVRRGNIQDLPSGPDKVHLLTYHPLRQTAHTKQGYVSIQFTLSGVQFYAYIHTDHLEIFLGVYTMNVVKAGLLSE